MDGIPCRHRDSSSALHTVPYNLFFFGQIKTTWKYREWKLMKTPYQQQKVFGVYIEKEVDYR